MTRSQRSAVALVAGILGSLVVMALHPTGADVAKVAAAGGTHAVARNVHILAIMMQPLLLAGTLGLTVRLRRHTDVAALGFVSYALGTVAIMFAAVCSGLLAPDLIAAAVQSADPAERERFLAQAHFVGDMNQAMAQVWVALAALAIGLWSLAMRGEAAFPVAIRVLGAVVSVAGLWHFAAGDLALDVRGFGIVVLVLAVWVVGVGVCLWRAGRSDQAS